ncbi:MAG: hypothetical protein U9R34_06055 [Nanoarchaeota archaeon]|nr:hypothetical protein [Nanoarchaeota archaeon]
MESNKKQNKTTKSILLITPASMIIIILLTSLITISGCEKVYTPERPTLEDIEEGFEGLVISFIQNAPPPKVIEDSLFDVGIKIANEGTSDVKKGYLLLGYEKEYIGEIFWQDKGDNDRIYFDIAGKSLNMPTGEEQVYLARIEAGNIGPQREQAQTLIYATACYDYNTKAHANLCVDTDIYNLKAIEKVCSAADIGLSDQGAPVAVTRIESIMMTSKDEGVVRPQLKIYFSNVGQGTIIKQGRADTACSSYPLAKDDINTIRVSAVLSETKLSCKPELLKLRDSMDYTICTHEQGIDENNPSYYAPLTITAEYGYMETISKDVTLMKSNI